MPSSKLVAPDSREQPRDARGNGHATDLDVSRIVGRIREQLGRRRSVDADASAILADSQLTADLSGLYGTCDPAQVTLASHRKVLGRLVVRVKRMLGKLLTPVLSRQAAYNTMNARVAGRLHEHLAALVEQQGQLREEFLVTHTEALDDLRREFLTAQRATVQKIAEAREELLAVQRAALQGVRDDHLTAHRQAIEAVRDELLAAVQEVRESIHATELETLQQESRSLQEGVRSLREEMGQVTEDGQALRRRHDEHLLSMRERLASAEGRLRRVVAVLTHGEVDRPVDAAPASWPPRLFKPEFDSLRFGERFWGSEAELRERRRMYVEVFKGRDDVVDIGCGRGEFLGLLAEAGITARGVDTDVDMILLCREKGLEVAQEDLFTHLTSLPDASLGGIFAAQIVEHFDAAQVIELVRLCHRKLRTAGVLVMETPNPMCLMVFAQCFYMDFTHTRPINPEALKFLAESAGFADVTLSFTSPVGPALQIPLLPDPRLYGPQGEQFNRSMAYVNELLFGYQDYAIIARK